MNYQPPKGSDSHPYRYSLYGWNIHALNVGYAIVHLVGFILGRTGYIDLSLQNNFICSAISAVICTIQYRLFWSGTDKWPSWDKDFVHIPYITAISSLMLWWIMAPSVREATLFTWVAVGVITYNRMKVRVIFAYLTLVTVLYILTFGFIKRDDFYNITQEVAFLLSFLGVNIFLALHSRTLRDLYQEMSENEKKINTLNQVLMVQAEFDMLTNTYNRYRLEKIRLHNKKPTALVFLDIDYFKQYNDYFGHTAGDHCLIQIAKIICAKVQYNADVIRYGGDEFLVFFHNTLPDFQDLIKNLYEAIVQESIPHNHPHPHSSVTVSIGGLVVHDSNQSLDELIAVVDHVLYQVKKTGRNGFSIISLNQSMQEVHHRYSSPVPPLL